MNTSGFMCICMYTKGTRRACALFAPFVSSWLVSSDSAHVRLRLRMSMQIYFVYTYT